MSPELTESLERIVSRFEDAWDGPAALCLEDHLPPPGAPHRLAVLVELVHIDLERRLKGGEAVAVAAYLERFPELNADPHAVAGLEARAAELLARRPAETPGPAPGRETTPPTKPTDRGAETGPGPGGRVGTYELLERLGGGGMGEVFRARHARLKKEFALKVLSPRLVRDPEAARRFERETEALGRLEHPHLVRATDAGVSDGTPYLVMELLAGTDLSRLTKRVGPWPVAAACEAARQAALGLHHAHERGLVHRDVKPSNLWLTPEGAVKVLDLGLARLCEGPDDGLTGAGRMMGTPDYVAPEQVLDSRAADFRADLYGLGCTLYHLLAGAPPFGNATHPTTARKHERHLREPPPDLRARRVEVPAELAGLLGRLLAKRPEGRPGSAAEVAAALRPLAQGGRLGDLLGQGGAATPNGAEAPPARPRGVAGPRPPSRRRWLALAGGAAAAGLGWAGWASLRRAPRDPPPAAPLTVRALRVLRFGADDGSPLALGELGGRTFRAHKDDLVELEAELSGPGYAYLLACNPADEPAKQVQLCLPADRGVAPELAERLRFPANGRFKLDDGVGLQGFAVVASRQPLPPYAEWRRQAPALGWKKARATAGIVWRCDGRRLERLLAPGDDRGTVVLSEEEAVLEGLGRALRSGPGVEAVALVAFAVAP